MHVQDLRATSQPDIPPGACVFCAMVQSGTTSLVVHWQDATAGIPGSLQSTLRQCQGGIRWKCDWVNKSIVCAGEYAGLEEIDDGIWNVYFDPLTLGRLHERHMPIEDEYGRLKRHKGLPMSSDSFVTFSPTAHSYPQYAECAALFHSTDLVAQLYSISE